ncbi:MAG: putative membrane protein YeaQ/YmgE (transglycosylase-associated protein family) [Patescibacteria group bacterium]|jgi:uncharacterized membrane protein YeaQ/YmgE (transglycosylase-associated protein family)
MKPSKKSLILASIAGFFGSGLATTAGSTGVLLNMFVGAIGAVIIVFLLNGFFPDN